MDMQYKPICKGKILLQPGGDMFCRARRDFAQQSQNQVQQSAIHRMISRVESP